MQKTTGALMLCLILACCSNTKTTGLGVRDGRLLPCPGSPNCVSTQSTDDRHSMEPIRYTGPKEEARQILMKVIGSMKGALIVTDNAEYLHVVFTSRVFRFKDDVEFFFDDAHKLIHFRSASRMGYSDLGVNRKRMDEIEKNFSGSTHE
jgi:uncharacterized protein (DUF1499 family)